MGQDLALTSIYIIFNGDTLESFTGNTEWEIIGTTID